MLKYNHDYIIGVYYMAKGIIYLMNTCVDGLVKIGKTGIDNFEQRMTQLEIMDIEELLFLHVNLLLKLKIMMQKKNYYMNYSAKVE